MLSSARRVSPPLPDGPARPGGYCWLRSYLGPGSATGRVEVGAHRKTLLDARPTAAPVLVGGGGGYQHPSLAGPYCLADEEGAELPPSPHRRCSRGQVAMPAITWLIGSEVLSVSWGERF